MDAIIASSISWALMFVSQMHPEFVFASRTDRMEFFLLAWLCAYMLLQQGKK